MAALPRGSAATARARLVGRSTHLGPARSNCRCGRGAIVLLGYQLALAFDGSRSRGVVRGPFRRTFVCRPKQPSGDDPRCARCQLPGRATNAAATGWHPTAVAAGCGPNTLALPPTERPTRELRGVRPSEGKEDCAAGARHDRRSARMHGHQQSARPLLHFHGCMSGTGVAASGLSTAARRCRDRRRWLRRPARSAGLTP